MTAIDNYEIDITCPNCDANNPTPIVLVKTNPTMTCAKCGTSFKIHAHHYASIISTIEGTLKNLGV